jgi:hypothetical protein
VLEPVELLEEVSGIAVSSVGVLNWARTIGVNCLGNHYSERDVASVDSKVPEVDVGGFLQRLKDCMILIYAILVDKGRKALLKSFERMAYRDPAGRIAHIGSITEQKLGS